MENAACIGNEQIMNFLFRLFSTIYRRFSTRKRRPPLSIRVGAPPAIPPGVAFRRCVLRSGSPTGAGQPASSFIRCGSFHWRLAGEEQSRPAGRFLPAVCRTLRENRRPVHAAGLRASEPLRQQRGKLPAAGFVHLRHGFEREGNSHGLIFFEAELAEGKQLDLPKIRV